MVKSEFRLKRPTTDAHFESSAWILLYIVILIGTAIWLIMTDQDLIAILVALLSIVLIPRTPLIRRFVSPFRNVKPYLDELARRNDQEQYGTMPEQYDAQFYPAIAGLGRLARAEYGYNGTLSDVPLDIYLHTYRSLIRRDIDRHEVLVLKAKLPYLMPHTYVMGKNKTGSLIANSLERTFDDDQRVGLQNDLDDSFLLFTHRRTVTDALTIWSPQLLEKLRNQSGLLSVETIGHSVYLYVAPGYREFDMNEVLGFFEHMVRSLKRTTRTNFLKLPNDAKYPFLRSRPNGGLVKIAGSYYSYALLFLVFINMVTGIRFALNPDSFGVMIFFFLQLSVSLIIYIVLYRARSQYTKTSDRRGY